MARRFATLLPIILGVACQSVPENPGFVPAGWQLRLDQDFADAQSARAAFEFSDPKAWRIDAGTLELVGPSDYRPPVRSPRSIALLADLRVGDFVLEAEVQQTGREYGHRDLCVFFGYQAPDRFYYTHVASKADPHAHSIFLVDRNPRRSIATKRTQGVHWGRNAWHRIRVNRNTQVGTIDVFFDGTPILHARDRTLLAGRVGLGSFDDTGRFRRFRLWTPGLPRE